MDVASRSMIEKVGEALKRSLPLLGPEARREVEKMLTPEALRVMTAVLIAWVAAHFIGVGEAVDVVLAVAGAFAIGMSIFDGIGHLWGFAEGTYNARTDADLDAAAKHFADAVAILGIQAAMMILFKSRPRTYKGGPKTIEPAPSQPTSGMFARPILRSTRSMAAGEGGTYHWGDIIISRLGTSADRRLAALHESVHRFLTPRFSVLRLFRVRNRAQSYSRSALAKYIEEALAETVAQVGVYGFRSVFRGISFPVRERYVTVLRADESLRPFVPEVGGLVAGGFLIAGMVIEIWETPSPPRESPSFP